ncbi:TRAM domain-containing protein [Natrinema zhouii]|uniref:TRAM domain-containing protein n=1 Tax=Natrinema zhouii TaxID=1710539 RepID=A0A7D6GTB0_9EURY|nr:TRAM domain-containing protein [Natrinema zhouii]QLK24366.1 TRAM domain-containing protein [Natrinema zhouii]
MKISDRLLCLFSGQVEERDESYVVEVPKRELRLGDVDEGQSYRIAVLSPSTESNEEAEHDSAAETERESEAATGRSSTQSHGSLEPPVEPGETRTVEIEDVGDQGDGITRVERGFVVIVSGTDKGERVRIEITQVQENVAFADVVERLDYYE